MTDARAQILAHLPRAPQPEVQLPPATPAFDLPNAADQASQFLQSALANGFTGDRVVGIGASRLAVLATLRQAAIDRVYASPLVDVAVPGLLDAMGMIGIEVVALDRDPLRIDQTIAQPKPVGMGLLVAIAAWADSGAVVLQFPVRRSALAYGWPPRTLVLLPRAHLFVSPRAWLDDLRSTGRLLDTFQTDLSLVSGLSATQDVASIPVAGVYGAGAIQILLIEPEASL